jgi:hypothetical protein
MRITIFAIVSGIGLSITVAAMAAEQESIAVAQPVSDSQKIICHNMTHEGMLLQTPQCRTQYAWDKERRQQEQWLTELQLRATQTGTK